MPASRWPARRRIRSASGAQQIGFTDYVNQAFPAIFWDLYGVAGHPVRTTISEMGPLLLGRILALNDVQTGVLNIAFKYADDNGLLLLDLKDLRALLVALNDNSQQISATYGNVATGDDRRRAAGAAGARAAGRRQVLR